MLARATTIGSGLSSTITLYILATKIPQPPVFSNQVVYCYENVSTLGNVGLPMTAWDPNGSPLTFTILSQPVPGMFVPVATPQGQVVRGLAGSLDFFVKPFYNLSVIAVNGLALPLNATANVSVQLLWVDLPPVVPAGQSMIVKENAALGTVVGQLNFTDRDTQAPILDAVTIAIVSQDATPAGDLAPFNVSTEGLVRVAAGTGVSVARLVYAAKSMYSIIVSATDRFGAVTIATLTVTLSPINQKPIWPAGGVSFFAASQIAQSVGAPLGTLVTDPNIAAGLPDSLYFAFANSSQNLQAVFAIDRNSGQISVVNPTATLFLTGMVYTLVSGAVSGVFAHALACVHTHLAPLFVCRQSM